MSTRRNFVKSSLSLGVASMAGITGAPKFSFGQTLSGKTLINIFMPGGSDGLELFPKVEDPFYQKLRPTIAWAPPGNGDGSALLIERGAPRALNPHLEPLMELWSDGRMMVSPATALSEANRSHFDCQRWIGAGMKSDIVSGYLNRYLGEISQNHHVLRAAVLGKSSMSPELNGDIPVPTIADIARFELKTSDFCDKLGCEDNQLTSMLREVALPDDGMSAAEQTIRVEQLILLETIDQAKRASEQEHAPVPYSDTSLGRGLHLVSCLLKGGIPLEVASLEWKAGWDTHAKQRSGPLNRSLRQGALDLVAFYRDMGPLMDDVIVLIGTEFGRTIRENGSRGTDHGRAGAWIAFGGSIRAKFADDVPTLDQAVLGAEATHGIPTLVDYRDLVGEIMVRHMDVPEAMIARVFPHHSFTDHNLVRRSAA